MVKKIFDVRILNSFTFESEKHFNIHKKAIVGKSRYNESLA